MRPIRRTLLGSTAKPLYASCPVCGPAVRLAPLSIIGEAIAEQDSVSPSALATQSAVMARLVSACHRHTYGTVAIPTPSTARARLARLTASRPPCLTIGQCVARITLWAVLLVLWCILFAYAARGTPS